MVKIQCCLKVRIILPLKFLHHNFVLHCKIWHFLSGLTKTSMTTSLSYIFLSLLFLRTFSSYIRIPQYYLLVYFIAPALYVKCKINQISCVYRHETQNKSNLMCLQTRFYFVWFSGKKKKTTPFLFYLLLTMKGHRLFPMEITKDLNSTCRAPMETQRRPCCLSKALPC